MSTAKNQGKLGRFTNLEMQQHIQLKPSISKPLVSDFLD